MAGGLSVRRSSRCPVRRSSLGRVRRSSSRRVRRSQEKTRLIWRVPSYMVLPLAPPARLERATYGFEGLWPGTAPNRRLRPTDYPLGTLPKQSPYAVSGLDNSVALVMPWASPLTLSESPEGWDVQKNVAPIPRKSTPAAQVVIVSASR